MYTAGRTMPEKGRDIQLSFNYNCGLLAVAIRSTFHIQQLFRPSPFLLHLPVESRPRIEKVLMREGTIVVSSLLVTKASINQSDLSLVSNFILSFNGDGATTIFQTNR